ncbi:MAG: DUF1648 domain-containing protein [Bacteroidales bacterium]|jgi:uncharacterized membrane protein|nr:DUF1648 domain-containing protein [Bacteroidales bacterium]
MILFRKNRPEADRPVIRPEMAPADWLLETLALIGILSFVGVVVYYFPRLPEIIPSHFNGIGNPDGYESKMSIWALTGVALFIYTLLTIINLFPFKFNFPVKITPGNALRHYTMAMRLIRYLKVILIWIFFYNGLVIIRISQKSASGLGFWSLPIFLGLVFVPVIIYFIFARKSS